MTVSSFFNKKDKYETNTNHSSAQYFFVRV